MIKLDRLLTWLNTSTLQTSNNPLYQVIKHLIQAAQELQDFRAASSSAATGFESASFLTRGNETATLPNSVQLVAGTNITFDDSVANQRTINASGSGSGVDYVVMSDGANPPSPMDDGNGNFIYVTYTP